MVLKIRMIAASKKQSKKQKRIQPLVVDGNMWQKQKHLRLGLVLREDKDFFHHHGKRVRLNPVVSLSAGIESNPRIEMQKNVPLDLSLLK